MEERICETCGCQLIRRDGEKPYLFLKRRYCNNSCSKKSTLSDSERLFSYVTKTEACWIWTGGKSHNGYGLIKIGGRGGKRIQAHRMSFLIAYGHLPENVLHRCDNPACVRPDHLFGGSHQDNMDDMIAKGRAAWQKKRALTDSIVAEKELT